MMQVPNRPPAAHSLRWFGHTDRGKVRSNNEDSFLGLTFDAQEVQRLGKYGEASTAKHDFAFAVSDGMGGAMAGEFASRIAVEKITRLLPRAFKQSAAGLESGFGDVLTELVDQIHKELTHLGRSYEECRGMGTTLSLAWFAPGWMYFAHVGDSRIYYLPANGDPIRQLTHDHTYVGWLFRKGDINEREAREHPRRNVLQNALGAGHQFVETQVGAVGLETGDAFVLCSDGVVDGLFDSGIEECIRSPIPAVSALNPAERIVKIAVERSGRDNTTAVVIEVH